MTSDFVKRGLVVNSRLEEYDGPTAVTRSAHLSSEEIEYMRWKAERWMKVRHLPAVLRHDPAFVLRNGRRMLAHTFRGSTWKSVLGLEDSRAAFRRYRAIREGERRYLDWPDPIHPGGSIDATQGGNPPVVPAARRTQRSTVAHTHQHGV
jgi:anaerobic magnesium-protoporphyrin IX monomethyl ester cyclase